MSGEMSGWVDKTSRDRFLRMKKQLKDGNGKRMSLNLKGPLVAKLDALIAAGFAKDSSDAIRRLIEEKQLPEG